MGPSTRTSSVEPPSSRCPPSRSTSIPRPTPTSAASSTKDACRLPPADAVRVEELINYFHFDYADQIQGAPFGITTELAPCPWDSRHKLALIGLQARRLPAGSRL